MYYSFMIGIAGGSASGKSTLANALCKSLGDRVTLLAMDSYYKPESALPLVKTANGKEYRDYNAPQSFELERLKEDIRYVLDNRTHKILIVEGLLTLWDEEIEELCDIRVFVDCPSDVRVIRRIKRNMEWGLTFDEITDVYLDLVRHRHEQYVAPSAEKADLVISSDEELEQQVQRVLSLLRGLML